MTRRDIGVTPPNGVAIVTGPVISSASATKRHEPSPSPPSRPHPRRQQDDAEHSDYELHGMTLLNELRSGARRDASCKSKLNQIHGRLLIVRFPVLSFCGVLNGRVEKFIRNNWQMR
jgi:hypothetical protein